MKDKDEFILMRVLLILAGRRTIFRWVSPPLGILQLAGYLRSQMKNLEIRVVDQRATDYTVEEVISRAVEFAPDVVGISCTTSNCDTLVALSSGIRLALPKALLMVGGAHASAFGAEPRTPACADCVVVGEGELTCEQGAPDLAGRLPGFQRRAGSGWRTGGRGVPDESRPGAGDPGP